MITKEQWCAINLNQLGLRSEDNETVIKGTGASYAMDMGKPYKLYDSVPEDWDKLLRGTIQYMKDFEGSAGRYLMIVQHSTGGNMEYSGCFPKCSHKAESVLRAVSLDHPIEDLIRWVESSIQ